MSGICGFGGPDKRFSATEEEAMREDFTTSAVLNKVGKDAGDDGAHVGVRDAMEWANKPGNEAAKAKLQEDVCNRDARHAQAHVTYRI